MWHQMDLGSLINQSAAKIKKNLILFVPPIVIQIVVPFSLFTVAALTLFPLMMALGLTGDVWGVIKTAAGGGIILLAAGFLVDTFVTAGWAYMNRCVVIDGQTELGDLWVGARKYFLRILGGRVLIGMLVILPIAAGIGAMIAGIMTLNIGLLAPEELVPTAVISLLAPIIMGLIGILLVVGLIELVLGILLLPWMQALVMDDLGIIASIKSSFRFVRRNFGTIIGYVGISAFAWIVVSWAASLIWPSFSYSELTTPAVYMNSTRLLGLLLGATNMINSVISALLSGFFTLLLFLIYADRTREVPSPPIAEPSTAPFTPRVTQPEASRPSGAPRGMKYCQNCGATLVSLAVFCPSCGARQPPLTPQ